MKTGDKMITLFSTGFYTGYFPIAPATFSTLTLGVVCYLLISHLDTYLYGLITLILCFLAIWLSDKSETIFAKKDCSYIVIDELVGFLITMFLVPFSWINIGLGFFFFRLFDIVKPPPANFFNNSRQKLSRKVQGDGSQTDLQKFLGLFNDRKLATDIFTIVEDGRIDYLAKYFYRGISQNYNRIQNEALSIRPPLTSYPLKEVALEVLLQLSLGFSGELLVPCELSTPLYLVDMIMRRILSSGANVEDSAEATIRLYRILFQLPNDPVTADHWEIMDFSNNPYISFSLIPSLHQRMCRSDQQQFS